MNSAIVYAADTSRMKKFLTDPNYLDREIPAAVIDLRSESFASGD